MSTVTTIGLDIAKSVFQVHGISVTGEVLIRRQVRRGQVLKFIASLPPCPRGLQVRYRGLPRNQIRQHRRAVPRLITGRANSRASATR